MKLIRHFSSQERAILAIVTVMLMVTAMLIYLLLAPPLKTWAQSGVLIPSTLKNAPDASLLSLEEMDVDVLIDNQHARVEVRQIFENHTNQQLEGKYLFAMPPRASLSDFAIWENDQRLPGVIYEKRRANQVYGQLKNDVVDPGLMQQDDEHGGASAFSAKVFPIPAYGTKRVELTYTEALPVENFGSHFRFPLKASFGAPQRAGRLHLRVRLLSDVPLSPLTFASGQYDLKQLQQSAGEIVYEGTSNNVELKEDLAFSYNLNVPASTLSFITHRVPERISAYDLRDPALAKPNPDGYFEARVLFNEKSASGTQAPRKVVLMLDTSLSMHGEKLARAVEALDYLLHHLKPADQFNLLLFNDIARAFEAQPQAATPENIERALAFVKASYLGGGTDLAQALRKGLELGAAFPAGERSLVLISDANATRKTIQTKPLLAAFTPDANNVTRFYALALGSDANEKILNELTRLSPRLSHGYFTQARETESIAPQLQLLFAHLGRPSIENLQLNGAAFSQVYATSERHSFDGASFAFLGRYATPQNATVSVSGMFGAQPLALTRTVALPAQENGHEHLPREWARARVNALLREMDLNGEREDLIAEIIRLSQKYRFVTPYTAFLAAPRALLRPRVIQPGDPVIRVKTDPAIVAVTAVLPFGETLPLRWVKGESVWQTRFLAPVWMPDGVYRCRLLLTDKDGNAYQEEKTFVIDSQAPRLDAQLPASVRAGEELTVRVTADSDTTRLTAKLYGAAPVALAWSAAAKANVGTLRVPAGLAAGTYALTVMAEDAAHNQAQIEVNVNVLAR